VGARQSVVDEAARRARYQLAEVIRDLRARRLMCGQSISAVAAAIGCSRQLLGKWERGTLIPGLGNLAVWGAVLGLDIPIRTFDAGSPMRDAGQLRLLARARGTISAPWRWRTEVPVAADYRERRAVDAVLSRPEGNIGLEADSCLRRTE
jgi:transcriptional regulator with XRE-family HTH domain